MPYALSFYAYECLYVFAKKRFGIQVAKLAEHYLIVNWFITFCGARLLINQTEMLLNLIGLWLLTEGHFKRLTVVVGINFMIRPTAAIFWLPFIPEILKAMIEAVRQPRRGEQQTFMQKYWTVIRCSMVGIIVVSLGCIFDLLMSGTITSWEFFKFNFMLGGSGEFGVNPWWWYILNGIPSVMGPLSVLLPAGLFIEGETRRLSLYIAFYLVVYSVLAHKEIRFILPVLPLILTVTASVVDTIATKLREAREGWIVRLWPTWHYGSMFALQLFYILNIGAVFVIGVYHQCGIRPAAQEICDNIKDMKNPNVWILTPCFSVPVFTYFPHPNASFEYYVCAPKQYRELYDTPKQLFQPNGFRTVDLAGDIKRKLTTSGTPDFVLAFDKHVPTILDAFQDKKVKYFVCSSYFHTFLTGGQFPAEIKVLCNNPLLRKKKRTETEEKRTEEAEEKREEAEEKQTEL